MSYALYIEPVAYNTIKSFLLTYVVDIRCSVDQCSDSNRYQEHMILFEIIPYHSLFYYALGT